MLLFKFTLLLVLAAISAIAAANLTDHNGAFEDTLALAGGIERARPNQFPWQATIVVTFSIYKRNRALGSLISNKHVVSSGAMGALSIKRGNTHVVFSMEFARGQQHPVKNVIVHPNFQRSRNLRFNIGVFILQQPIRPSPAIRPIALARTVPAAGQTVRFVGFSGLSRNNNPLLWRNRQILSRSNCGANIDPNFFLCVAPAGGRGFGMIYGCGIVWRSNNQDVLAGLFVRETGAQHIKITPHVQWLTQLIRRN